MIKFALRRFSYPLVKTGVGPAFRAFDAVVIAQGFIELLFLGVEFGQRSQQLQVVGLLGNALFVFLNQARGNILAFDLAVLLLERDRLLLIFEDIPVGAFPSSNLSYPPFCIVRRAERFFSAWLNSVSPG